MKRNLRQTLPYIVSLTQVHLRWPRTAVLGSSYLSRRYCGAQKTCLADPFQAQLKHVRRQTASKASKPLLGKGTKAFFKA